MTICVKGVLLGGIERCTRMHQLSCRNLYFMRLFSSVSPICLRINGTTTNLICSAHTTLYPLKYSVQRKLGLYSKSFSSAGSKVFSSPTVPQYQIGSCDPAVRRNETLLQGRAMVPVSSVRCRVTDASLSGVPPSFIVMKFDQEGNVTTFEKRKTELCQELSLQARDLRFQHSTSLTARNNCIIIRMQTLKAIVTPQSLLVLDFRGLGLERWLVLDLASQLASQTHSLPFEFRALEAILQHKVNSLQAWLNDVEPVIMDILESLVDPKILSADRSKLHVLLQNSKSLSELETDIKVFKDSLLKILDEDELIEEFCLTKWTDPRVFEEISLGIDHAEEMELLLDNYYLQAEELGNRTRELKGLIDDSESVIFINLDSHRNVMMRLNLQLTMGSFSLTLFGLIGVAFGMNLSSTFEEDPWAFWLVTGFMFLGSGMIWRRLLSFLGRHLEPSMPPVIPTVWKRNLKASDVKIGAR
ncbi:magnesium transporter MRS2 homolog, mitochondrial isoform X1 [Takifugu rubripes]|uniref:Magnesium transporter n=2 Tax=Takifugu rubripes TaxID=31033 RepID=H2TZ84_TAKRU|nr:magnesium transporter MRS2 homolog, mitochondrial isoform X1 [Takifugu rubripes]|eukprot:XP_011603807.1 PREDICTED: magnesium transporter MRS2 homolog, mitochondrial isoform X1 [Takifugu rubripes]